MPGFITQAGLDELANYKYKSGGYTWFDSKMNTFWEWSVRQVPEWVAPNLLTFIGWLFVIASYTVMLVYDYTFTKNIPSWTFFFAAFCIFVYSTLDAIDGKQARRTKSSSPLGQLFDHGCDSFSITFFMLAICQAIKLQKQEVFYIFLATQLTFFLSNWMEYNTGILKTNVGQFGVTEGEFICLIIHVFTGIFGQDFWAIRLGGFLPASILDIVVNKFPDINVSQVKLGLIIIYFFGTLLFCMCAYSIISTVLSSKDKVKSISEVLTAFLIILMQLIWMRLAIYEKYVGIILVNFGIMASLFVCKMIVSSVTKMKLEYFHREIIPLLILTVAMIYFNIQGSLKMMIGIFWVSFAINLFIILRFLYLTINQLTDHLGIYCFSLQKKDKRE